MKRGINMNIVFCFKLANPYFVDVKDTLYKRIYHKYKHFFTTKQMTFDIFKQDNYEYWFAFVFRSSFIKKNTPGLFLEVNVFNYYINFYFCDRRFWDYEKNCFSDQMI